MPWQRLRRPHVLKIRGLLEEHYQAATANRMLSALRDVFRECWQAQLMTIEDYQTATNISAVRGESERRRRDLSTADCATSSRPAPARRCRDTAKTPPRGAGATPPCWPWPTAAVSAAPR